MGKFNKIVRENIAMMYICADMHMRYNFDRKGDYNASIKGTAKGCK